MIRKTTPHLRSTFLSHPGQKMKAVRRRASADELGRLQDELESIPRLKAATVNRLAGDLVSMVPEGLRTLHPTKQMEPWFDAALNRLEGDLNNRSRHAGIPSLAQLHDAWAISRLVQALSVPHLIQKQTLSDALRVRLQNTWAFCDTHLAISDSQERMPPWPADHRILWEVAINLREITDGFEIQDLFTQCRSNSPLMWPFLGRLDLLHHDKFPDLAQGLHRSGELPYMSFLVNRPAIRPAVAIFFWMGNALRQLFTRTQEAFSVEPHNHDEGAACVHLIAWLVHTFIGEADEFKRDFPASLHEHAYALTEFLKADDFRGQSATTQYAQLMETFEFARERKLFKVN